MKAALTISDIEEQIVHEQYFRFPGTTVTVCCITLRNGFCTVGESACVTPENFDQDIGRRIAREEAVEKIWVLEGYRLKQSLHERSASDS